MSEEDFIDDEYIDSENDPCSVEKITENNSVSINDEEKVIEFDEIFETIQTEITNLAKHDRMMEEKVLDSLRGGKLK